MTTDAELAQRIKLGEKPAFQELYERYAPRIYHFSNSYLKNETDAEELVQDVFLKIWEKREILEASQNLKAYIFKIAVNSIYDFIRRKNIENAYKDFSRLNYTNQNDDTWHSVVYEEMKTTLDTLIQQMPEQRRRIFDLSKNKGLTNDEIALRLGLSKRTVENQLYRAVSFLKNQLQNKSLLALLFFFIWYS